MRKLILPLVGFAVIGVAMFIIFNKRSTHKEIGIDIASVVPPPAGNQAFYLVKFTATQKNSGSESSLIDLDGVFSQIKQSESEYLTEWQNFSQFKVMNDPLDSKSSGILLHKPMLTNLAGKDITHYIGKDFPPVFLTFQLSLLQKIFVGVKPEGDKPIVVNEKDEVGVARVQYDFAKEGLNYRVKKTWLRYNHDSIKVDAAENYLTYGIAADGRLLSVEGVLTLHYRLPTSSRNTTHISVVLRDHKKINSQNPQVVSQSLQKTTFDQAAQLGRQAVDQNQLTYIEALQKLDLVTDKTDSKEAYVIFTSLKAEMIANPEHANTLVTKILDTKGRDPSSRRKLSTMFGALAQSQSSDIANSLANLANECPDNFCKVQAIVGLNDHPSPLGSNAESMLEIARNNTDTEISGTALLAAGSIGRKLDDELPDLAKALIGEMGNPSNAEMKSTVLAAMGNHGAAEYFQTLNASLSSKDPNIRSSAAYSMRYLPNEEVNHTLITTLQKESEDDVRREAIKAMHYRNLTDVQYLAIAETSATFKSLDLQQTAARMLIEAYHDNPKIGEASLKAFKDQSSFPEIKTYIESQLKPSTSNSPLE